MAPSDKKDQNTEVADLAQADFRDLTGSGDGFCPIKKAEHRAITISQLKNIVAYIEKRLKKETWLDRLENAVAETTINLYDTCKFVLLPCTFDRQCSYVERVAKAAQLPVWFVSHWWGEPIWDFIMCLVQHCEDRRLDEDKDAYWVCAYANNQWELSKDVAADPAQTSFHNALTIAQGTVSILDEKAVAYTRVWCSYEVYVSLQAREGYKYDVYTVRKDGTEKGEIGTQMKGSGKGKGKGSGNGRPFAVGLTDGLTKVDMFWPEDSPQKGAPRDGPRQKLKREGDFPMEMAEKALAIQLETAEASQEPDRRHILNSICGVRDLDGVPPAKHPQYQHINNVLRGRFAAATWSMALWFKSPMAPYKKSLYSSELTTTSFFFYGAVLSDDTIPDLADSLPDTLEDLKLGIFLAKEVSDDGMTKLTRAIGGRLKRLRSFEGRMFNMEGLGDPALAAYGANLSLIDTLEEFKFAASYGTNFTKDGFGSFFAGLKLCKNLRTLEVDVQSSSFDSACARHSAFAIKDMRCLEKFSLICLSTPCDADGYIVLVQQLPATLKFFHLNCLTQEVDGSAVESAARSALAGTGMEVKINCYKAGRLATVEFVAN